MVFGSLRVWLSESGSDNWGHVLLSAGGITATVGAVVGYRLGSGSDYVYDLSWRTRGRSVMPYASVEAERMFDGGRVNSVSLTFVAARF
jgi:hypothetical protein